MVASLTVIFACTCWRRVNGMVKVVPEKEKKQEALLSQRGRVVLRVLNVFC